MKWTKATEKIPPVDWFFGKYEYREENNWIKGRFFFDGTEIKDNNGCVIGKEDFYWLDETEQSSQDGWAQDLKELDASFNYLYKMEGVKDCGHRWIEFSDKWEAFKRKYFQLPLPASPDAKPLIEALKELKYWYVELGKGSVTMNYDVLEMAEEVLKNYNQ
jgi:hypothetical protein